MHIHVLMIDCFIYIYIYTTSLHDEDVIQTQFLSGVLEVSNPFSFSLTGLLTKVLVPDRPYYLPIAAGRTDGFLYFPRVLALWEMQITSYWIWTRLTVSISYHDNYHITSLTLAQIYIYIYIYACTHIHKHTHTHVWVCFGISFSVYLHMYLYWYRLIGLVGRVFANGSGDLGSIPGRFTPKTLKMVLDTSLL